MRMLFVLVGLLSLSGAAAQDQGQSANKGVVYGIAVAQDGIPAKGVTLNASPLGVPLGMAVPWTKTNEAGFYRFEHLPLGRYTVYAEDEEAGYSIFSTGAGGAGRPPEVELTAEYPEAEFNVHLPPPAGLLLFHLTNRTTGVPISGGVVTVMSEEIPPKTIFGGSFGSSRAILVPSHRDLLLHVTSWGFLEWEESVGSGKHIHVAPGNRLTLNVQLQPSNPLTERIPDSDPKAYQGIRDGKEWRNPYLIIRADGIKVAGVTEAESPVSVDAAMEVLESLPVSAWPFGRVVAIQDSGMVGSEADQPRIQANRDRLMQRLYDLGVIVAPWPAA